MSDIATSRPGRSGSRRGACAETVLLPKLAKFLPEYPDIKVEVIVDNGMIDIVAERYDAGVRAARPWRRT